MSRRTALKLLGSALALSSLKGTTVADEKVLPWKIGLGLNGFASAAKKYKKTFPIREVLDFASRTGFDGIELTMGDYPKWQVPDPYDAARKGYRAVRRAMIGA